MCHHLLHHDDLNHDYDDHDDDHHGQHGDHHHGHHCEHHDGGRDDVNDDAVGRPSVLVLRTKRSVKDSSRDGISLISMNLPVRSDSILASSG